MLNPWGPWGGGQHSQLLVVKVLIVSSTILANVGQSRDGAGVRLRPEPDRMEPGTQPETRCPALSGPHRLQRRRLRDDGRPHAADPIRFGAANAKADFLCNQNQSIFFCC